MEFSPNWKKYLKVAQSDTGEDSTRRRRGSSDAGSSKKRNLESNRRKKKSSSKRTRHLTEREQRPTAAVAMDCEMVGIADGRESVLARVSIVNSHGATLYDTFVKPREPVVDYRTHVSGVRPEDLENGVEFSIAQKAVADLLRGRILVGHAVANDLRVLYLNHPRWKTRDTSKYGPFRALTQGRTPSLKRLAKDILGLNIQEGEHSSVEDAWVAMQLYIMYKREWERDMF